MPLTIPANKAKKNVWYILNHSFWPHGGTKIKLSKIEYDGKYKLFLFKCADGYTYLHHPNEPVVIID